MVIAIFFTLLPDIDESSSKFGRKARPLSNLLKHRGFFHSIWLPMILVIILYRISFEISLGIFIGYASHLVLDSITKGGIAFFFPFRWKIRGFAKTGGLFEKMLFMVMFIIIIILLV